MFRDLADMRVAANGILFGVIIATILAVVNNALLVTTAVEGDLSFGFNGGLQHKNYFGVTMVCCFIAYYLSNRYSKKASNSLILMVVTLTLLLASNSRGSWMLLGVFLILKNFDKFKIISKRQRKFISSILLIMFGILGVYIYKE